MARIVATAAVLAILLAACANTGTDTAPPPTAAPTTEAPPTTEPPSPTAPPTTQAPTPSAGAVDWTDQSVVVDLGDGWTIRKCEGDGPFLCVERDGSPIGALEASSYPIVSFDSLDVTADPADNLATFVAQFHEGLGSDRAQGCGADYGFEPIGPDAFSLGGQAGVAYGFTGTLVDGSPSELNLQYATVVDDRIVSITAIAYDEGGCPGRDDLSTWKSATLAEFRPYMEQVLEVSPLPDV